MERMNVVGLEADLKERLELCELCDFKSNYLFVRTQTLDLNLNLLCVNLGHAKRFAIEIFSIALITCFVLIG